MNTNTNADAITIIDAGYDACGDELELTFTRGEHRFQITLDFMNTTMVTGHGDGCTLDDLRQVMNLLDAETTPDDDILWVDAACRLAGYTKESGYTERS